MGFQELTILLAILLVLGISVLIFKVYQDRKAHRARNKSTNQKGLRTYAQAEKDYERAKTKLERDNNIFVIDFVHDMSERHRSRDIAHQHIEFEQAFRVIRELREVTGPVAIVLHTFGGYSLASEMIASAIKAHRNSTVAYVPYVAFSGGTVIALASRKINMGKNAALGPIDTQFYGFSGALYDQLVKGKSPDAISDEVFLLALEARLGWKDSIERAIELVHGVHRRSGDDSIRNLATGLIPHDQRILPHRAKELGFQIHEECPEEVYELVDAKLQMLKNADREAKRIEKQQEAKHSSLWNFANFFE